MHCKVHGHYHANDDAVNIVENLAQSAVEKY